MSTTFFSLVPVQVAPRDSKQRARLPNNPKKRNNPHDPNTLGAYLDKTGTGKTDKKVKVKKDKKDKQDKRDKKDKKAEGPGIGSGDSGYGVGEYGNGGGGTSGRRGGAGDDEGVHDGHAGMRRGDGGADLGDDEGDDDCQGNRSRGLHHSGYGRYRNRHSDREDREDRDDCGRDRDRDRCRDMSLSRDRYRYRSRSRDRDHFHPRSQSPDRGRPSPNARSMRPLYHQAMDRLHAFERENTQLRAQQAMMQKILFQRRLNAVEDTALNW